MIALRVMDTPEARKAHDRPTPKGGGAGIVVAFLVGLLLLYRFAEFARLANEYFLGVIAASLAIAVVAFLDDLYDWPFTAKLGIQALAALVAVGTGIYVHDYRVPYVGPVYVGWIGPPVTLAWLLFTTNAVNFIDGLNGLASGVMLIACGVSGVFLRQLRRLVLLRRQWDAGGGLARLPAVQLPPRADFHGRCRQPVLRLHDRGAGRGGEPVRRRRRCRSCWCRCCCRACCSMSRSPWCAAAWPGERLTQPHRGHLYQVAQRSGVPAVTVTLIHWGFAVFGGLCCLVFLNVTGRLEAGGAGDHRAAATGLAGVRGPDARNGAIWDVGDEACDVPRLRTPKPVG